MVVEKDKLLHRIFKKDAEKRGMDMKDFYHKRRKGLMPFLNPDGKVEWLKRKEFRIATVKKIHHIKRSKNSRHHRHSHHHEDTDFAELLTSEIYKYFFIGLLAAVVLYIFFKLLEAL